MRSFYILLKKEIRELTTLQVILPLLITVLLFAFIGKVMGKEQTKLQQKKQEIILVDNDRTASSALVRSALESNLRVNIVETTTDINGEVEKARLSDKSAVVVIPSGFETSLKEMKPKQVELYSIFRSLSFSATKSYEAIIGSVAAINNALSNQLISQKIEGDPNKIKNPLAIKDYTVIGNKQAQISPTAIAGFVSAQTTFIPIILFMVIVFASQMIATTIATEKENKTLETLLTTPVGRKAIVASKMVGAGIVALLSSIIYMFGFRYYMEGVTGGALNTSQLGVKEAVESLGLAFSPENYVVLAISLFFGILAALAVSLILGAFAEDVKGVASLMSPLMIVVAIPYFLTMFLDINTLSPAIKYLVWAIPFSHSFLAGQNLMLGDYLPIVYGIGYQLLFFIVFLLIATKIFSTDKIVTMKLSFGRKK